MNTFRQWMLTSYNKDDLASIAKHGCISGCASGLIYYSETNDIYDKHCIELHNVLANWIDMNGEAPEFVTKHLDSAISFKNAMVWFVAEFYANAFLYELELTQ
jgi:hypothetical protein